MKNVFTIDGYQAVVQYDPEIGMFRGEFVGLNGGADFYATDVAGLTREGRASLAAFLAVCAERGIEPRRHFSGKFNLRVPARVHEAAVIAAAAEGESLNQWIAKTIEDAVSAH